MNIALASAPSAVCTSVKTTAPCKTWQVVGLGGDSSGLFSGHGWCASSIGQSLRLSASGSVTVMSTDFNGLRSLTLGEPNVVVLVLFRGKK
jgi:hypothetical protein